MEKIVKERALEWLRGCGRTSVRGEGGLGTLACRVFPRETLAAAAQLQGRGRG